MISNFNQGDIFQIISPHSDEKIWKKLSDEDFTSVKNRLICWLSKDVLRRRWIVSGVTKPYTVVNFGNTLAMTIFFFFWKRSKFDGDSINGTKNRENVFCFEDNWIWIGNGKFSQSGRAYL